MRRTMRTLPFTSATVSRTGCGREGGGGGNATVRRQMYLADVHKRDEANVPLFIGRGDSRCPSWSRSPPTVVVRLAT